MQSTNTGSIYTRNEILRQAFRKSGILAEGQNLSAQQTIDGQRSLNNIVYSLINKGLQLWKYSNATLFLTNGQVKYTIGTDLEHCTEDFSQTTCNSALTGDFTITVANVAGILDLYKIGIVVGSSIVWTTVNGAPVGNVVTLTDALTVDVPQDSVVIFYKENISKPNQITQAWRRISGIDVPLYYHSRQSYFALANKSIAGTPTSFYYEKRLTEGDIYLYPATTSPQTTTIVIAMQKPFFVFDSAEEQCDAPLEYMNAIIYGLASDLCVEYGIGGDQYTKIMNGFNQHLMDALNFDREPVSIYAQPNLDPFGFAGGVQGGN